MMPIINELMLAVNGSVLAAILAKVTVVLAVALACTRLARRSPAAVRHVFLAAAFAVLLGIPIASFVAPTIRIAVPIAAQKTVSSSLEKNPHNVSSASHASLGDSDGTVPTPSPGFSLSAALLVGWIILSIAFLLQIGAALWQMWLLRKSGIPWHQGQSILESLAVESGIHRHVEVLLHKSVSGPMTCGVVRPTVLLPENAPEWPQADLHSAMIHELEHVRRRDWVSQGFARAVCACYWFHPLVWVAWRRLVLEAERACDDAVLRRADAAAYADQLVALAERLSTTSNRPSLAMANPADLAMRVRAVLDPRQRRGRAGRFLLVLACSTAVLFATVLSSVRIVAVAQAAAATPRQLPSDQQPKFDVASIRPCAPGDGAGRGGRGDMGTNGGIDPNIPEGLGGYFHATPGRLDVTCGSILSMVDGAYIEWGSPLLNNPTGPPRTLDHIQGVPQWALNTRYTIHATSGDPLVNRPTDESREGWETSKLLYGPMLQRLLEDRFHLKLHHVIEEVPMYALTVASGGLKVKQMVDGDCIPEGPPDLRDGGKPPCNWIGWDVHGPNRLWLGRSVTMNRLAADLGGSVLDRNVIDQTGIAGSFMIRLEYSPDETTRCFGPPDLCQVDPTSNVPAAGSIFSALRQLGLELEPITGPREHIVIDHVEPPSEN